MADDSGSGAPPGSWVVLVAGGSGARFGADVPKQYLPLAGRRVLDWSLEALASWVGPRLVLVVPEARVHDPEPLAGRVVAGGATRSDSVRCGLAAVPADARFVLVHDAARPLVVPSVVRGVFDALEAGADAVVPGLPVTDTVKRVKGTVVVETLERSELVAVQTPQGFGAEMLRKVHTAGAEATDDAALVERHGGHVVVVPGSAMLRKVTTAEDLQWLELRAQEHGS